MNRPVHIGEPIAINVETVMMAAESPDDSLTIVAGIGALERVCMAFTNLDAEDRRDAAMLALEQPAGCHLDAVGADRRMVLFYEDVEAVATIRDGEVALH